MSTDHIIKPYDIAIVGIGSLFPGSVDKNAFWKDIFQGIDRITDIPQTHWDANDYFHSDPHAKDKTYCKRGGFLPSVPFDPLAFGIPPHSLTATDTGQLLGLLVAKQTLDDFSQNKPLNVERERISVILGTTGATELITDMASRLEAPKWRKALIEEGLSQDLVSRICKRVSAQYPEWQESTFPGLLSNVIAGRIANRLNLKGTNLVTDAACASSLAALQFAIQELLLHQSDLVLTGGVDTLNTIFMYMCFSKTPALSPTGECQPFSENSDGTLIGEGIGMIALKRLRDAEAAGDKIYAVIKGLGTSSDGLGKSIYAPVAEGQERALRKAYEIAAYTPDTVELVEAHGTGTKAGDLCELESLTKVFAKNDSSKWCALGSVKSQIGHTKAAAGVAGIIKASLALHHKILAPTIKVTNPHEKIKDQHSPFYINTASKPWIRSHSHPRRASVSSFGFGGSNFHVTLEEYLGKHIKKKIRQFSSEAFFFGASSVEQLRDQIENLESQITNHSNLNALAHKHQKDFKHSSQIRVAFVARTIQDLSEKLMFAKTEFKKSLGRFSCINGVYFSDFASSGSLALLFPGQGSQYLGMSSELTMHFSAVRNIWDKIADLKCFGHEDLHKIVFPQSSFSDLEKQNHEKTLQNTEWAQAAIAASSAAMFELLKSFGIQAKSCMGHSLGAFSALYAAGSLTLKDLVQATRKRGLLMSKVTSNLRCGMLAVSASSELCEKILSQTQTSVCIANKNSQDQTILSGELAELNTVSQLLAIQKISHRSLPVSTAFHSQYMKDVQKDFEEVLLNTEIQAPRIPVISGFHAKPYLEKNIVQTLLDEISAPVEFMQSILELYKQGTRVFLEVGPRNVLTKLTRRILKDHDVLTLALDEIEDDPVFSLWNTLAQLSVAGVPINLQTLCDEFDPPEDFYPQNTRFSVAVNGANLKTSQQESVVVKEKKVKSVMDTHTIQKKSQDSFMNISKLELARQIQMETAKAHSEFQNTLSNAHLAFLKSSESCFGMLMQNSSEDRISASPVLEKLQPIQVESKRLPNPVETVLPSPVLENEKPLLVENQLLEEETFRFTHLQADIEPTQKHTSDYHKILIDVIAEKTGYPQELIQLEMSLDTDLGIDSIKRVEIFSELGDKIPEAASIDPQVMNKLSTLQNILDFFESNTKAPLAKKNLSHSPTLNVLQ